MSQENIKIAGRAYEALNRRGVEGAVEFLHPEVEIHDFPQIPDTRLYRGHDGLRQLFQHRRLV